MTKLRIDALAIRMSHGQARIEIRLDGDVTGGLRSARQRMRRIIEERDQGFHEPRRLLLPGRKDCALDMEDDAGRDDLEAMCEAIEKLLALSGSGIEGSVADRDDGHWSRVHGVGSENEVAPARSTEWIRSLEKEHPDLTQRLGEANILDDGQYLEMESRWSPELRQELAEIRFDDAKSRTVDLEPAEQVELLARFAHPWVEALPPGLDDYSRRAANVFAREGIESLSALRSKSAADLAAIHSLGPTSLKEVARFLSDRLSGHARSLLMPTEATGMDLVDEQETNREEPFAGCGSLADTLESIHMRWNLRDKDKAWKILSARIGEPLIQEFRTLEELGEEKGVSRERIRQIEQATAEHLRKDPEFARELRRLETRLVVELDESGSVPVGKSCPVAALRSEAPAAVERFLRLFDVGGLGGTGNGRLQLEELGPNKVISLASAGDETEDLRERFREAIERLAVEGPPLRSDLERSFDRIALQARSTAALSRVRAELDAELNWVPGKSGERPDDRSDEHLVSRGDSLAAVIAAILETEAAPMSDVRISELAAERFGKEQGLGTIRNELISLCADPRNQDRCDVFVPVFQFDRGTYCTGAGIGVDVARLGDVATRAAALIAEGRTCAIGGPYQWHCRDLVAELEQSGGIEWADPIPEDRRWRVLDAILRYHHPEEIFNLFKGYWVAALPGQTSPPHRREQLQAAFEVLRRNPGGTPMKFAEVKEGIREIQSLGASDNLQLGQLPRGGVRRLRDGEGNWRLELEPEHDGPASASCS